MDVDERESESAPPPFQNGTGSRQASSGPEASSGSETTPAPSPSDPEPSFPTSADVKERLHGAMDRFALRLMDTLSDRAQRPDGTTDAGLLKLQMEAFKMAESWILKRERLKPSGDGGESIAAMQEMMNNPKKMEELIAGMGFVKAPPVRKGRPTKAVAAQKKVIKEAIAHHQAVEKPGVGWLEYGIGETE